MTGCIGSTVTRTFAAPPTAVFDAWVTRAFFTIWWGGSAIEVPLESTAMDVRPGGSRRATMILGSNMPVEPGEAHELLTATFTAVGDGTEMVFSRTGGHLPPEQYEATTVGWKTAFDTLDAVLAA